MPDSGAQQEKTLQEQWQHDTEGAVPPQREFWGNYLLFKGIDRHQTGGQAPAASELRRLKPAAAKTGASNVIGFNVCQ